LQKAHRLYVKKPIIEASIIADQDAHAKEKKAMRLTDKAARSEPKSIFNELAFYTAKVN